MPTSTRRKAPGKLAAPVVKSSAKVPTKNTIDETRASIAGTDTNQPVSMDIHEISSDSPSDDEEFEEDEFIPMPVRNSSIKTPSGIERKDVNGKHTTTESIEDEIELDSDNEEIAPSFGELLRGHETIDVPAMLQQTTAGNPTSQPARTAIVPPSHQSLTTVLTQALKTDDTELLESCLHTTDLPTIRNTIERIDSSLAGNLLNRLAARLYRRPGRAGNLMTWVQWTLVSHGGALASQPKVVHSLNGLQKVLAERAKGLNSLLALKGKLDLLESQMDLRRKMQRTSGLLHQGQESDDEEEDVIWVEGETDPVSRKDLNGAKSRRRRDEEADDDDDEDDMPMVNGIDDDEDEEEDSNVQEDDDSEAGEESLDENDVDHDDVDESMGEDEESEVEAAPPSKMQKVGKAFPKRK